MFCTNCGKQNPEQSRFCTYCGANMNEDSGVPFVQQQPSLEATQPIPQQPESISQPTQSIPQGSARQPESIPQPIDPTWQEGVQPLCDAPAARRSLTSLIVLACLVALVAVGVGVWMFLRTAAPPQTGSDAANTTAQVSNATIPSSNSTVTSTDTVVSDSAMDAYLGDWLVDSYSSSTTGKVGFTLAKQVENYIFSAKALLADGSVGDSIDAAVLHMSADGKSASGSYQDSNDNQGMVTLLLADGKVALTITVDTGSAFSLKMEQETCSTGTLTSTAPSAEASAPTAQTGVDEAAEVDQAFCRYVTAMVSAINAHDFSVVAPTLKAGTQLYKDQQSLVKSCAKKGITEEVNQVGVQQHTQMSATVWKVIGDENIEVYQADGISSPVQQNFVYTVEKQADGSYVVTSLSEQ